MKKYHLKKKVKRDIFFIVLACILIACGIFYGKKKYDQYLYEQTYEYKLLQIQYNLDEIKIITDYLKNEEIDDLLLKPYNEFIPYFIERPYFLYKNLDKYLLKVVTKEQDFLNYKTPDKYDYDDIVAKTNVHAYEEANTGNYATDVNLNYSMLTNKYYKLPDNYVPDDLVNIPLKYYYGDKKQIRSDVYDAFVNMWNDAYQSDNIYLIVVSAYRSEAKQKETYDYYVKVKGTKYADGIAARPGYSEHQTGLALDIYSKENASSETFQNSKAYFWLLENAYKYGFILRYPENKTNITGYKYESWHYRYVGVELASKVHESGLTFDEYYAYYIEP